MFYKHPAFISSLVNQVHADKLNQFQLSHLDVNVKVETSQLKLL